MVSMVESILQLQMWMPPLDRDHALDVGHVSPRRLLTKDVEAPFQAGDCHFRGEVVRETHKQDIQRLLKELAIIDVVAHPIIEDPHSRERAIAHSHQCQAWMSINAGSPHLPNHSIAGNTHS